jgi:hypothetical protein
VLGHRSVALGVPVRFPLRRWRPQLVHALFELGDPEQIAHLLAQLWDAEREAEDEAEVLDELELALTHIEEDPVGLLGVKALDDHQLDVDELVDVLADGHRQLTHDLRKLVLDTTANELADLLRQLMPELGLLTLHDPLDDLLDVTPRGADNLLGDLLGVELGEDLPGVPILEIPLSTARLPILAAREGTMPCQPIPPTITPGSCRTR